MAYNSIFNRFSLISSGIVASDSSHKLNIFDEQRHSSNRFLKSTEVVKEYESQDCSSDDDASLDSWSLASSEDWTHVAHTKHGHTKASLRREKVLVAPAKPNSPASDTVSSVSSIEFLDTRLDDSIFETLSLSGSQSDASVEFLEKAILAQPEVVTLEDASSRCDLKTLLQSRLDEDRATLLEFKLNGYKLSDVEDLIVREDEEEAGDGEACGDSFSVETQQQTGCKLSKKTCPRRRRPGKECALDYSFTAVRVWEEDERRVPSDAAVEEWHLPSDAAVEEWHLPSDAAVEEWRVPSDAMFESFWRPEDDSPLPTPAEERAVHTTTRRHDHYPTQKQKKKTAQWSGRLSKTMRTKKSPY